jgi:hypothetical protein
MLDLLTTSGLLVQNTTSVYGPLTTCGLLTAIGPLTACGLLTASSLTVQNGTTLAGSLTLCGPVVAAGSAGATSQVLASTVTGVRWVDDWTVRGGYLSTSGGTITGELTICGLLTTLSGITTVGPVSINGAVSTSGPVGISGPLTVSGAVAFLGPATALTVPISDNSTTIATTAFVQAAVAAGGGGGGTTLSGIVYSPVTFAVGATMSGPLTLSGTVIAASADSIIGSTGTTGQVLTSAGAASVYWSTPIIGRTSAAYGNTALGQGATAADVTVDSIRNTAIGYNAAVPYPTRGGQIVLGTANETVYLQGGLALKVGGNIADPLPAYLFLRPLAQFYTITATNTNYAGTIQLPTPENAAGAVVTFRFVTPANGLVGFDAAGGNFYTTVPFATGAAAGVTTLFTPPAGTYVVQLISDGANWYQTQ